MIFVLHPGGIVTEYDWQGVRGLLPMDGRMLWVGPSGIHLVEGENDEGQPILARLRTGLSPLGSPLRKRPTAVLLAGVARCAMTVGVKIDDAEEFPCPVVTAPMDAVTRARVGRGAGCLKMQVEFSGTGAFAFDSVAVEIAEQTRRTGRYA